MPNTPNQPDKPSDSLFKRIQATLTLADQSTNQNEAANAAMLAARLIQKYNLTEDQVRNWSAEPVISHARVFLHHYFPDEWKLTEEKARKREEKAKARTRFYRRKRQYVPHEWPPQSWYAYGQTDWMIFLAGAVGRACDCEAYTFSQGGITYVGDKERVEQAAFLFGNIFRRVLLMAEQAVKDYAVEYKAEHGVSPYREMGFRHPTKFRIGYLEGACHEIALALYRQAGELRKQKREDGITVEERALYEEEEEKRKVALIATENAIAAYKAEHFAHVKPLEATSESAGSYAGLVAGEKAGENFTLQKGLGKGQSATHMLKKGA